MFRYYVCILLWCIYIWLCNNVNLSVHAIYLKNLKVTVLLEMVCITYLYVVCMHPIYVLILCVHSIMVHIYMVMQ